jgi:hypothetical protein
MPPQTLDLDKLFPVAMMHTAVDATRAPVALLDFDAVDDRSRAAAARVVEAYRAAMASAQAPSASMWKYVEEQHGEFLAAVRAGDIDTVLQSLRRMFHTHLVWGLGRVHEQIPVDIQRGHSDGLQIQVADVLVSLGEATSAALITNIEQQGRDVHFSALCVDLDQLLASIITRTGLVVDMPGAGGNYGCVVAGRRVSIDSLVHAYTVYRLKQLGVGSGERIAEIGGGYGCLAYSCRRNGFSDYTVFDLPWVNILQGYLHIMTLAPDEVSLFGEPDRPVKIRPFWEFTALGDRSVDVVINTDSMPEIGAATARQYIDGIARVTRRCFLSINQEAMADYPGIGRQQHVNGLAERAGLRLLHRHRYWMRQGYVEEIFAPAR